MPFKNRLARFAARAAAGLAAVAALASCGGGTYQVSTFKPARILVFGDESSMLTGSQGLKYSINGVTTDTDQIDCSLLPLWDQVLAANYTIVFPNCNSEAVADPTGRILATVDADVDAVQTQVDTFLAGDGFNDNDFVAIWVGMHDVLDDYAANATGDNEAQLLADMSNRGSQLAGIVNSIVNAGGKVLLLTVPDMGLSPYAWNENEVHGDFDRAQLLTDMSDRFNRSLRSNVINDGSRIGLVLVDDFVKSAVRSPGSFGLAGDARVTPGCDPNVALPNCSADTLVVDPSSGSNLASTFLWADDTHLGAVAQQNIGTQTVSRATTNPF